MFFVWCFTAFIVATIGALIFAIWWKEQAWKKASTAILSAPASLSERANAARRRAEDRSRSTKIGLGPLGSA
jgi:hypothetical protein